MKDDVGEPGPVPTKRRALHDAPAVWLAKWLERDDLTTRERKLVEAEKERRKSTSPDVRVGLIIPAEGVTPKQLDALREALPALNATEVHHGGVPSRVHTACRMLGVPVIHHDEPVGRDHEVVKASSIVVAAPKETRAPVQKVGVWEVIKYAKHRSVPVRVVMPDGNIE